MDADERVESRFTEKVGELLEQTEFDVICFRLYDFWDENHYREDRYWRAHLTYRPFLCRYRADFRYLWPDMPLHCGRFPENIFELPNQISDLRIKHFGWARIEDRMKKFHRYLSLDPEGRYGNKAQYESILDENPNLVEWIE